MMATEHNAGVPASHVFREKWEVNPFGRRIYKLWPTGTPFYYVYDGANMVAEIRNTGATITDFVQGQGIDQPLAQDRNGGKYYMEADGLGSITSMTGTTGAPTNTYIYNSFGVLLTTTGNTADNFNRYTAREADISTTTNWYYYKARYYDPQIGRFISEDSIGNDDGSNLYVYVANRPTMFTDPTGLYKLIGFPPEDEQQMNVAIEDAIKKVDICNGCAGNLGPKIANMLRKATFVFKPNLKYCGETGPLGVAGVRHVVSIGPSAFTSACCKLSSTLAHEATHLTGGGEGAAYGMEQKCFGCSDPRAQ